MPKSVQQEIDEIPTRPTTMKAILERLPDGVEMGQPGTARSAAELEAEIKRLRASLSERDDLISKQNLDLNTIRSRMATLSQRLGAK